MWDGQPIDFSAVTACGECCGGCRKKADGTCPGCIEADGYVPEWAESGRCRVHACARSHGVCFCGICGEFPCKDLAAMIPWNPRIAQHLEELAGKWRSQGEEPGEPGKTERESQAVSGGEGAGKAKQ